MNCEIDKQLKRIEQQESKILNKKDNELYQLKIAPWIDKIQDKIPTKLKATLEIAFCKGFCLVFEKGDKYIEKTYSKDKIQLEHEMINFALDKKMSHKYIKRLDQQSNHSNLMNSSISVVEGSILGVLGIGLPDIPLFISVLIKSIYEVALSYGYQYDTRKEKNFILLLICGALSEGENQKKINQEIDLVATNIDQGITTEINFNEQMKITSALLSEAMLTAKFIQGIPIVGVVGGAVNYTIHKRIGKYASLKYKKRYLLNHKHKKGE